MINNLKGYNNRRLLEEVGLLEEGIWNNIKAGALGTLDGSKAVNSNININKLRLRNSILGNVTEKEVDDAFDKSKQLANNIRKTKKGFSDSELKSYKIGAKVGLVGNPVARLGLTAGGIYGANKLYVTYIKSPADKIQDDYNEKYDKVQDTYDDVNDKVQDTYDTYDAFLK